MAVKKNAADTGDKGKGTGYSGVKNASNHKGSGGPGKVDFLQGGNGHMFGRSGAEPMKPGTTAPVSLPGKGGKFIEGGHGNHMFPRMGASPMKAGETGRDVGSPGSSNQFAQGGKTHMFGRRGSQKRSPGETGGM